MATPEQAPVQTFQSDDEVAQSIASLPADVLAFEEEEQVAATPEKEPAKEEEQPEEAETEEETEAEEATEETEEEAEGEDPLFEVTLPGGETAEVPLSELAAGYSRLQDYKAKTAEVAEMRRTFEQERQTELAKVQETQGQLRQVLEQYLQMNPVGQPPSRTMLDRNSMDYDPDRYHLEKDEFDRKVAGYYQTQQQLQRIQQENERIEAEQRQTVTRTEMEKLKAAWPEFYDEAKAPEVRNHFLTGLKQYFGIDAETVSTVLDHRFYLMAKAAIAMAEVKSEAPKVAAKLKVKPKVVKPGTRTESKPKVKAMADARAALKRSGKESDAIAAFGHLVDQGLL